jgi:hypothetical protein
MWGFFVVLVSVVVGSGPSPFGRALGPVCGGGVRW